METISPGTRIGAVTLRVAELSQSLEFYRHVVGLELLAKADGQGRLGAGERELLILQGAPGARSAPGTTGLYHLALLLPSRRDLAAAVHRILRSGYSLEGAADHIVSEAVYLRDPEGNGIEIYSDRPRAEWLDGRGKIRMGTLPFDLPGLLREFPPSADGVGELPQGTGVGHIHLHVSSLEEAESFYCGVLGFGHVMRYGTSAGFVSAGGYHHHIGLNTWAGEGAPPPPTDARGLVRFQIVVPDRSALDPLLERLEKSATFFEETADGVMLRDPSQNGIALTVGSAPA